MKGVIGEATRELMVHNIHFCHPSPSDITHSFLRDPKVIEESSFGGFLLMQMALLIILSVWLSLVVLILCVLVIFSPF